MQEEMNENVEATEVPLESESESVNVEMIEKDVYVRLLSDFENYKRRSQKEKEEYLKTASQKLLLDIIPIMDNFERAGELETGVQLVYDILKKVVDKHGLKEIDVKGLDFNADTMEALTQIVAGDDMIGKVVDVFEKGYELNGKIIRFAKVTVGI